MPSIFLNLPQLRDTYSRCIRSVYDHIFAWKGGRIAICCMEGGSISRCRNMAITRFLAGNEDYFLCFDDDIEILNDSAKENIIDLMLEYQPAFVAGLYACRADDGLPFVLYPDTNGPLRKAMLVPTGCWLLPRKIIADMQRQYGPELDFVCEGEQLSGLFCEAHFPLPDGKTRTWYTEDFAFCHRWRMLGGTIWADRRIRLAHWGRKAYLVPDEILNWRQGEADTLA